MATNENVILGNIDTEDIDMEERGNIDAIYVNIIGGEKKVWISSPNNVGCEYECKSKEDLIKAFTEYIREEYFM